MHSWIPLGPVLLPLLGLPLARRQRRAPALALLLGALAGLAALILQSAGAQLAGPGWRWIDAPLFSGRLQVDLVLRPDPGSLTAVVLLQLFAGAIAWRDHRRGVADLALWGSAAALALLGGDLAVVLVGWGLLGLAQSAPATTTPASAATDGWAAARWADALLLVALAMLIATVGTLDIAELGERAERLARPRVMGPPALWGASAAAAAGVPLALAVGLRAAGLGSRVGARLWAAERPDGLRWLHAAGGAVVAAALWLRLSPLWSAAAWVAGLGWTVWVATPLLACLLQHRATARARAALLAGPARLGAALVCIDAEAIGGLLRWAPGALLGAGAWSLQRARSSRLWRPGALGLLVAWLGFWLIAPHPALELGERPDATTLTLRAASGPGYRYLWDFDSDGAADTAWSPATTAQHSFGEDQLTDGVAVLVEPGTYGWPLRRAQLRPGQRLRLQREELGPVARLRGTSEARLPWIVATRAGLRVRLGGIRAHVDGRQVAKEAEEIVVQRGETLSFGLGRVSVTGLARPTVFVRNAFGLVRSARIAVELPALGAAGEAAPR